MASVAEERERAPRELTDQLHRLLDDARQAIVVDVRRLQRLHVDVRVLVAAADSGREGGEAALPVLAQGVQVDQLAHLLGGQRRDGVDLVRGAETVGEVHDGHARLERCDVRDQRQVLAILHALTGDHAPAAGASGHDVLVVAEDGESLSGEGPRGHMDDAGHELTRDLVHVRDHQEKALRRRECGGEATRGHGAVERARGASLRLQLLHIQGAAEGVLHAGDGPSLADLGHRRGGGDREDEGVIGQGVGHVRGRSAPIPRPDCLLHSHALHGLAHRGQRGQRCEQGPARLSAALRLPLLLMQEEVGQGPVLALRLLRGLHLRRACLAEAGKLVRRSTDLLVDVFDLRGLAQHPCGAHVAQAHHAAGVELHCFGW
mmetsp:Transcript_36001/g.81827  ORF Transcript_36001/g.81827 Transcript_36001/m.81827 type:complete len:375 (+) Transcript_36001:2167-3291(+)